MFSLLYISANTCGNNVHTCGSIDKRIDSVPHSMIYQKKSASFKPPSCRASGNGAPLISGCLVSLGFIHHMPKFWLCKHPTSIMKLNPVCTAWCDWLHWNTLGSLSHWCHNWCRYDRRLSFSGLAAEFLDTSNLSAYRNLYCQANYFLTWFSTLHDKLKLIDWGSCPPLTCTFI